MILNVYGNTNPGLLRERNEDSYYYQGWREKNPQELSLNNNIFLAVVDGMGGHAGGDVASRTVVEELERYNEELIGNSEPLSIVKQYIKKAHAVILEKAQNDYSLHGMGSTLVSLLFTEGRVIPIHVGDSRAYFYRDSLTQLTRDHSEIQLLLELGLVTPEKVKNHPRRGIIFRNLGMEPRNGEMEIEVSEDVVVQDGDIFLLCSDGLTDMLEDGELARIIEDNQTDLRELVQMLISEANNRGGYDNITVIVAKVQEDTYYK